MGLAEILKGAAKGSQHQYNQKTLGADYAERLAKVKLALEAGRLANKEGGLDVAAKERAAGDADLARAAELEQAQQATYPVAPGEDPSDVTVTPQDPEKLIARFRAMKAAEASGLATRKTEADIGLTEAQTAFANARPDIEAQKIDLQIQRLQEAANRAEDAGKRAEIGQQIRMLQIQQQRSQFESREGRLDEANRMRSHVTQGSREKFEGIASLRFSLHKMGSMMKDPEIANLLGPISGRASSKAMEYLGGQPLTQKQQEFFLYMEDALSQEAFAKGGQQLTGGELIRFRKTAIQPGDTLGLATQKLRQRQEILTASLNRRYSLESPMGQTQLRTFMSNEGLGDDIGGLPPDVDSAVPATSPGKPVSTVPGGSNAPAPSSGAKLYKYKGQQVPFEQLPPDVQAKVRARGL